jgi:uncharacterized protein
MSFTDQSNEKLYQKNLEKVEEICRSAFNDIGSHGWEHVLRVRALCRKIGTEAGANLEVLDLAALFHDTMRLDEDHALRSAEFADSVLSSMGFDKYFISRIHEAVASHSFSSGRTPVSIEAKVLSDADRLDAMGAIGVYRTVQYNLENGYPVERLANHIREKLIKLEAILNTPPAKRMARERAVLLEIYLESLERELSDASISR